MTYLEKAHETARVLRNDTYTYPTYKEAFSEACKLTSEFYKIIKTGFMVVTEYGDEFLSNSDFDNMYWVCGNISFADGWDIEEGIKEGELNTPNEVGSTYVLTCRYQLNQDTNNPYDLGDFTFNGNFFKKRN